MGVGIFEMTAAGLSAAEKRHSWAWQGCGSTIQETAGGDILEGTPQTYLSNSVEVLKPLDDKKSYELMMMVPILEKDPWYTLEPISALSASNRNMEMDGCDIYKISKQDIDLTMDAETLMVELGELKSLIANGCAPLDQHFGKVDNSYVAAGERQTSGNTKQIKDTNEDLTRIEFIRELFRTVFHVLLLLVESLSWLSLYNEAENPTKDLVLFFLIFPTLSASAGWICYNFQDRSLSCPKFCQVFVILVFSIPSPIFL